MSRGYFGIGICGPKRSENVGGLWRSAHAFGASFIFTAGARYARQPSDTTYAERHVPLFPFVDGLAMADAIPANAILVGIETDGDIDLPRYVHPERAVYVLGAEDHGLSAALLDRCTDVVEIPSGLCLNVATAGAIVLYDRLTKATTR